MFVSNLLVLRKDAKLPGPTPYQRAFLNWRNEPDTLSIEASNLPFELRVLLLDDVIQFGNSIEAAVNLLQTIKAQVAGIVAVYNVSQYAQIGTVEIKSLLGRV